MFELLKIGLGKRVYAGNSTNKAAEHVEKVKFPQELFPECRWSRKGFMRTRWLFNDTKPLDLVNIHLFHDASNLVAMETTPSPYAQNRQRALDYTLDKISLPLSGTWEQSQQQPNSSESTTATTNATTNTTKTQPQVPLFIFGDFNFRLDTNKVIQRITEGVSPIVKKSADNNEVLEFIYHRRKTDNKLSMPNTECRDDSNFINTSIYEDDSKTATSIEGALLEDDDGNSNCIEDGSVVMTVGKKLFDCENLDETFRAKKNTEWLQELDNELDSFKSKLLEFKISFSPSYPFKEDTSGGYSYMKTRCPAWCDRILFNAAGGQMIHSKNVNLNNNGTNSKMPMDSEKRIEILQDNGDVIYRLMGNSVPMGDHKPVFLFCKLNIQ